MLNKSKQIMKAEQAVHRAYDLKPEQLSTMPNGKILLNISL